MGFKVIEDLDLADKLAEAGLLWYGYSDDPDDTRTWSWDYEGTPTYMQESYKDYTFYILTEE